MTYPSKLTKSSLIRVISPSCSLGIISESVKNIANKRFEELGLRLSFGKHVSDPMDECNSTSIESRVEDLNMAFSDKDVSCVLCVIGGHNSNQILPYLDYEIIKNNPKLFMGFSDITALSNAIYSMTGLVTYSGPTYSTFGQELNFEYTLDYFKKCLMSDLEYEILPSKSWSNDKWYIDQKNINLIPNSGYVVINSGQSSGTLLGGNLCTLNLLQGTKYFPSLKDSILFIEDDEESNINNFDRDLESLTQVIGFSEVKGIVIGRFEKISEVELKDIVRMVKNKKMLDRIPVIANVDFGHTSPMITFPIGGEVSINASKEKIELRITKH